MNTQPDSSEIAAVFQKIHKAAFPGGESQIKKEQKIVHKLLGGSRLRGGKFTKKEAKGLLLRTKSLLFISKDPTEERIVASIMGATEGKVTEEQAKSVYAFLVTSVRKWEKQNTADAS